MYPCGCITPLDCAQKPSCDCQGTLTTSTTCRCTKHPCECAQSFWCDVTSPPCAIELLAEKMGTLAWQLRDLQNGPSNPLTVRGVHPETAEYLIKTILDWQEELRSIKR